LTAAGTVGSDTADILMCFPVEIPNQRGGCVTMIVNNRIPGAA